MIYFNAGEDAEPREPADLDYEEDAIDS